MGRDRAAYMREYRKRKRRAEGLTAEGALIAELEAEVARLKRELAARPNVGESVRVALKGARGLALDSGEPGLDAELGRAIDTLDRFNSRPFTPVPKTRGK